MTGSQKAIKIISIILIVVGIVALIAGLLTFAGEWRLSVQVLRLQVSISSFM